VEARDLVQSVRRAAAVTGVSPTTVRAWIAQDRLGDPPWTAEHLLTVRDTPDDRAGRRAGVHSAHGTESRWVAGCNCALCTAENRRHARDYVRTKAQARLPVETRAALLAALAGGKRFKQALVDLELTRYRVWGLARHDPEWSAALDGVLMATRRGDLNHGTLYAYGQGCVCPDCRRRNAGG
jgi:hypothetical protein